MSLAAQPASAEIQEALEILKKAKKEKKKTEKKSQEKHRRKKGKEATRSRSLTASRAGRCDLWWQSS